MKRFLKTALCILAIGILAALLCYSYSLKQIQIHLAGVTTGKPLKYHFAVITENTADSFWQSVKVGAESAGEKFNAAVEFNGPLIQDEDEQLEYMNIAIASRVDGIALYVPQPGKFTQLIDEAEGDGIKVVTVESDDKSSNREASIGPDSYNAGVQEGTLVNAALNGSANVAMILGGNYASDSDAKSSLLAGFQSSIGSFPDIRQVTVQTTNAGYFGAEKIIRDILNKYPEVNTVVSTSLDDTLEITQVLIDLNKQSKITLIGYGNTTQIREYIKNKNIYGCIYENPEQTGYQSIECLVNSVKGNKIPGFVDTGIFTITRSNLVDYPAGSQ